MVQRLNDVLSVECIGDTVTLVVQPHRRFLSVVNVDKCRHWDGELRIVLSGKEARQLAAVLLGYPIVK